MYTSNGNLFPFLTVYYKQPSPSTRSFFTATSKMLYHVGSFFDQCVCVSLCVCVCVRARYL